MRTYLTCFCLIVVCATTSFEEVAFCATKIPTSEVKAIACMFENKDSRQSEEIDRMPFPGIGGLWAVDEKCEKMAQEHAKQRELRNWRYLCCPITNDEKVHCESPLGYHGKWQ